MTKIKQKLIAAAIIAGAALAAPAAVSAAENVVGLRGGYTTQNHGGVVGLFYQHAFSHHFRLSPNIDYYFRHNGSDALGANVNAHFPIRLGHEASRWNIYPIAGVSVTLWSYKSNSPYHNPEQSDDVTTRRSRFGINTGCGLEFYATPTLKLCAEGKMNWVKAYSGGMFTLGIAYVF